MLIVQATGQKFEDSEITKFTFPFVIFAKECYLTISVLATALTF
jgi:hypothetical protein